MQIDRDRRRLLRDSAAVGFALATSALPGFGESLSGAPRNEQPTNEEKDPEVTATEDLMREHGVIRRALLVYAEAAPKLRQNASALDPSALRQTAQLFRAFGEDYHEKMLEEQHIFPVVRKMGGKLERYADILIQQHQRGREITDYILAVTKGAKIGATHAEPL